MSILNDATIDEMNEQQAPDLMSDLDAPEMEQPQQNYGIPHFDFGFLKAPTGDGSIDDYLDHVLNAERSRGMAQMLRGFTGIAGNLNLAILDITLGAFAYIKEMRNSKPAAATKTAPAEKVNLYEQPIINA